MAKSEKIQNVVSSAVIVSELGHVFCCVLPSVFSIITILIGLGAIGAMPIWMTELHDTMHVWEHTIIIFSAVILFMGWGLFYIGKHLAKEEMHCCSHDHNGNQNNNKRKNKTHRILIIATVLFIVNLTIYTFAHTDVSEHMPVQMAEKTHTHVHAHDH